MSQSVPVGKRDQRDGSSDIVVLAVGYSDSQAMVFSAPLRRGGEDVSMTPPADHFPTSTPETTRDHDGNVRANTPPEH